MGARREGDDGYEPTPTEQRFITAYAAGGISAAQAAREAGVPESNATRWASKALARGDMRPRIRGILADLGFDDRNALANLVHAAKNATVMVVDRMGNEHTHPDYKARIQATELSLKLWDAFPDRRLDIDVHGSIQVVTLQAEDAVAGGARGAIIDVTPEPPDRDGDGGSAG